LDLRSLIEKDVQAEVSEEKISPDQLERHICSAFMNGMALGARLQTRLPDAATDEDGWCGVKAKWHITSLTIPHPRRWTNAGFQPSCTPLKSLEKKTGRPMAEEMEGRGLSKGNRYRQNASPIHGRGDAPPSGERTGPPAIQRCGLPHLRSENTGTWSFHSASQRNSRP
jgi:hypothetical protein